MSTIPPLALPIVKPTDLRGILQYITRFLVNTVIVSSGGAHLTDQLCPSIL